MNIYIHIYIYTLVISRKAVGASCVHYCNACFKSLAMRTSINIVSSWCFLGSKKTFLFKKLTLSHPPRKWKPPISQLHVFFWNPWELLSHRRCESSRPCGLEFCTPSRMGHRGRMLIDTAKSWVIISADQWCHDFCYMVSWLVTWWYCMILSLIIEGMFFDN